MDKLSINLSDKDHRIFKVYAAAKGQTLLGIVVDSVKEKIARDMKSANEETKHAIHDSGNNSVQMKELAKILKEMATTQSHSFLGISSKNRKECHMESGLLFLYRIDNDVLYLERFSSHKELFDK